MVRAHCLLFALLLACVNILSNGRVVVVASSDVRSDESDTACTDDDPSSCGEYTGADADADSGNMPEDGGEAVSSPFAFMKAFNKLGTSWSHVIQEYISVVKGADGVDLKGDIYAQDMDEALKGLQSMVHEAAASAASKEDALAWSFHTTPLTDFGKTIDDVLLAFLRWSVVDNSSRDDVSCHLVGGVNQYDENKRDINVSKAFRRITSYKQWMQSVVTDLSDPPLSYESILPSLATFSIQVTHDQCGRLVWYVNLGKTDMTAFKSQPPRQTIRLFVWVAHLLFLDEGAQTEGLVVVDDMAEVSFWTYMTMLPINVGISVDRFLISVTPLKAKNVVLMHLPKWAEIGYGLLSWFLTAKMKSRVTMVSKGEEVEALEKVVGGPSYVHSDFGPFGGELKTDLIAQRVG